MEKPLLASRGQTFVVVFQQILGGILVHSSLQILSKSLRFQGCCLATFSFLHRFSMGFRSGDWLGHSRTLICFFLSLSFVALAVCFGSLSCWKSHLRPKEVVTQNFRVHGPIHPPLDTVKSSCPLSWETPPKDKVAPPCFTVGMVYSAFLFLQTRRAELMPNSSITSPSPKPLPDHPGVLWQTSDGPAHVPCSAEEPCAHSRISILQCSVLLMVIFVTVVPTAFRSLTSSSYVVLGWSLTLLIIIDILRGEILCGAPDRGRLAVTLCFFHFLIIAPTVVHCWIVWTGDFYTAT